MTDESNMETLRMLITSQKSSGDNIEKLYETVTERGRQMDAMLKAFAGERRAILAAIRAYLEDSGREDGTNS